MTSNPQCSSACENVTEEQIRNVENKLDSLRNDISLLDMTMCEEFEPLQSSLTYWKETIERREEKSSALQYVVSALSHLAQTEYYLRLSEGQTDREIADAACKLGQMKIYLAEQCKQQADDYQKQASNLYPSNESSESEEGD